MSTNSQMSIQLNERSVYGNFEKDLKSHCHSWQWLRRYMMVRRDDGGQWRNHRDCAWNTGRYL